MREKEREREKEKEREGEGCDEVDACTDAQCCSAVNSYTEDEDVALFCFALCGVRIH